MRYFVIQNSKIILYIQKSSKTEFKNTPEMS